MANFKIVTPHSLRPHKLMFFQPFDDIVVDCITNNSVTCTYIMIVNSKNLKFDYLIIVNNCGFIVLLKMFFQCFKRSSGVNLLLNNLIKKLKEKCSLSKIDIYLREGAK